MRYERKYRLQESYVPTFEGWLYENNFGKHFEKRQINSLYFDTLSYGAAFSNLGGDLHRVKYRLRWYGSLVDRRTCYFEIKSKLGPLGDKRTYEINLNNEKKMSEIVKKIKVALPIDARTKFELNNMPVTIISYKRFYFISRDQKVRVTIDHNLSFLPQVYRKNLNLTAFKTQMSHAIMEVKYEDGIDDEISQLFTNLPIVNFRNSKYTQAALSL